MAERYFKKAHYQLRSALQIDPDDHDCRNLRSKMLRANLIHDQIHNELAMRSDANVFSSRSNGLIRHESRWSNFDPYSNPEKNVECEHILSAIGRILPCNRESEASNEEALDELSVGSRLEQMGAAFAVAWDQRKSLVWRRDLM